jgi:hypothetical protein
MGRTARPLALALGVALAACGSSESDPPALYGDFAPAGSAAVIFAPTTCSIPFVGSTAASGLAIALTSLADTCGFLTTTHLCGSKANATLFLAAAISGTPGATSAPPFGPGTYPYLASPPTGAFQAAIASAAQTTATCSAVSGTSLSMTGGQITVTAVGAGSVTGTFDIRFADGSAYRKPFDVPLCPVTVDLCQLVGSGSERCVAGITPTWQCVP